MTTKQHQYDHNIFPGAVPRSFVGSVVLAWTTLPILHLLSRSDAILSKADLLFYSASQSPVIPEIDPNLRIAN